MIGAILGAFGFLTRLPVPAAAASVAPDRAAPWFPLVGAVVGAAVGGVLAGAGLVVGPGLAAALALTTGIALTGAFHEDGLGDTADGLAGGWTVAQRLEIMADPRQGTYGVVAIGCILLIRVAALAELAALGWWAVPIVAAVHLQARNVAGLLLGVGRPARPGGLAAAASGRPVRGLAVSGVWTVGAAGLAITAGDGATVAAIVVSGALAAGIVTAVAYRTIGGVTGDVLGAAEQVAEAAGLTAVAAVW